jgi:hypothetical protein
MMNFSAKRRDEIVTGKEGTGRERIEDRFLAFVVLVAPPIPLGRAGLSDKRRDLFDPRETGEVAVIFKIMTQS